MVVPAAALIAALLAGSAPAAATSAARTPAGAARDPQVPVAVPREIGPLPDPPAGSMVEFEAGGEKVRAYLARAEGPGVRPAVVVLHEWWGLNDQIKGVADRLAGVGFDALVPDLYRGRLAKDRGLAHELSRGLGDSRALEIVRGAVGYLRSGEKAFTRPVGTVGFCMGGRLALAAALRGLDVQATAMFYGSVETDPEVLRSLDAPVLGIFGAFDRGIPVEEVRKFEAALNRAGKTATILIYQDVGHAFFNELSASHDPEVAKDAWHRLKDFLTLHLRPGPPAGSGR
jgi:carboxymethylenebutenolidase